MLFSKVKSSGEVISKLEAILGQEGLSQEGDEIAYKKRYNRTINISCYNKSSQCIERYWEKWVLVWSSNEWPCIDWTTGMRAINANLATTRTRGWPGSSLDSSNCTNIALDRPLLKDNTTPCGAIASRSSVWIMKAWPLLHRIDFYRTLKAFMGRALAPTFDSCGSSWASMSSPLFWGNWKKTWPIKLTWLFLSF